MTQPALPGLTPQRRGRPVPHGIAAHRLCEQIGLRRRPRRTDCPTCGGPVLAARPGLMSGPTLIDALPVTTAGETAAIIAGIDTLSVDAEGFMQYRGVWEIRKSPAESTPVFVEHECGVTHDINFDTIGRFYEPKKCRPDQTEMPCPF